MVWLVASCEPPLWWPVSMWSVGTAGVVCARPARSDLYGGGARRRQTPPYGRSGAVLRRAADAAVGRRRRHRRRRVDAQRRLKTTTPCDAPPPRPFLPSTPTETGTAPPAPPQWVHNGACRHFPRITHVTCNHKCIILFIIILYYNICQIYFLRRIGQEAILAKARAYRGHLRGWRCRLKPFRWEMGFLSGWKLHKNWQARASGKVVILNAGCFWQINKFFLFLRSVNHTQWECKTSIRISAACPIVENMLHN